MKSIFLRLIRDESGTSAIEYAVIASVISVVCLTLPMLFGTKLNLKFSAVADALN
ncbi:Flp family type IVb pilin [Rhodoblastus sp.]|uniref:Flp family type IVb pilin n=1 Tax=Rhodoblastus sp. TaxID=1962975 RepID=UPI0035B244CF